MSKHADKSWSPCWRARRRSRVGRTDGPPPMTKPERLKTTATKVLQVKTVSTHRDQGRPHGGRQSCPRVQGGGMTLLGWVGVMSPTKGGKGRMSEQADKSWSPCWRVRRRSRVGQRTGRRVAAPGCHDQWVPREAQTTATGVVLEVQTVSTHRDQGRPHGGRQSCPRVQGGGTTLLGWVGVMDSSNQKLVTMLTGGEAEQGRTLP
jgi:hypothetical protein